MLSIKAILYILLLSAFMVSASKLDPCEPDCTGHVTGDKVEDPKNCTQYYYCMPDGSPTSQPIPCPNGTAFNPATMLCDLSLPCNATCAQSQGSCHLTCLALGDYVADPFECSLFYECGLSGTLPPQSCPSSMPHFDGEKCVNDESVCCNPGCDPYCEAEGLQVPDPTDCTKYYICAPEPIYPPFSCPPGEVFDIGYGRCTESAECKAWCGSTPSTPFIPDNTPTPSIPDSVTTTTSIPDIITTTTTSTSTVGECVTNFWCESTGFFPKCIYCHPEYFYCAEAGQEGTEQRCSGGLVFNPVPGYPYCIMPTNCPYMPFARDFGNYSSFIV